MWCPGGWRTRGLSSRKLQTRRWCNSLVRWFGPRCLVLWRRLVTGRVFPLGFPLSLPHCQASSERMEAWTEQMRGLGYAGLFRMGVSHWEVHGKYMTHRIVMVAYDLLLCLLLFLIICLGMSFFQVEGTLPSLNAAFRFVLGEVQWDLLCSQELPWSSLVTIA